MELNKYLEQKNNFIANNRLLKLAVVAIGLGLVVNAIITYSMSKRARTIIVPPVVNTRFELSGSRLSDEYVKVMTRYVMSLAANYTPVTARSNFDELLGLYDSGSYAEGKRTFYRLADTVETARVTASFFVQKITVDENKKEILVEGVRRLTANEQKVEEGPETYVIDYGNDNGRFAITNLSRKPPRGEK
ncbi:MAG: TraE protein [Syntrophorhabdaceae bacterium PtaU1.Bin034]|nr:MAG: TraE protein [Syntrophorhabdaceae bacterium PtaU1.Bin034]